MQVNLDHFGPYHPAPMPFLLMEIEVLVIQHVNLDENQDERKVPRMCHVLESMR